MHILIWTLTLLVLGLWSLLAWGTQALLTLDPSWVGNLKPLVEKVPYGALIERWLPGWQELLLALADLTQALLGRLGGAAGIVVWVLWGLGTLMLIGLAGLLSAGVGIARRAARHAAAAAAPPAREAS
jgi:hypothetical protein